MYILLMYTLSIEIYED